jgi:hypothetical protein
MSIDKTGEIMAKDRKGEALIGAIDMMSRAASNLRNAAKSCHQEQIIIHAKAFGQYEGLLMDTLHEMGSTLNDYPEQKRKYGDAVSKFVMAENIAKHGCTCSRRKMMREIIQKTDDAYNWKRVEPGGKVVNVGRKNAEMQYAMDEQLRMMVFGY